MKASKIMKMFTRCAVAALTFLDVLFVISVAAGIIRTIDRHGLSSEYLPTYLVILGLCLVIMIPLRKYWTREIPLRPVSGDINWCAVYWKTSDGTENGSEEKIAPFDKKDYDFLSKTK